ncbi:MAG TPA: Do family serine endopeptidase [Devosia sp.]|nr:Do family serine endopeptidase [Devosia sp.]
MRMLAAVAAVLALSLCEPALCRQAWAGPSGPQSVAALASQLSPAVVNISSSHRLNNGAGQPFPRAPKGTTLDQDLGRLNPNNPDGDPIEAESLGSGFIISADGLVVTNEHVIDGADTVSVYMTDGTRYTAKVVGSDTQMDLAVLRISAPKSLPFVDFGDSDTAQVGDWVMAIGNPFGLGGTVTLGIVSARNRDIMAGPYDSYIQTDASINQGNSGGPLFDMNGKVIGINTAIIAQGGASLGIGFAVPSDMAKPVVEQLAQYGEARRGWLGVGIQDVTDDIAASLGRPDSHGAMVTDVSRSGPAYGILKDGDIILTFDGKPIGKMRDLPRLVAEAPIGKPVTLDVYRDGKEQSLTLTLGELKTAEAAPKPAAAKPPPPAKHSDKLGDIIGLELAPLDAARRKTYDLPGDLTGLVITSVKAGSDADQKGFIPGLVVTEVNQQKVETVADVQAAVGQATEAKKPAVLFKLVDGSGQDRFIAVRISG